MTYYYNYPFNLYPEQRCPSMLTDIYSYFHGNFENYPENQIKNAYWLCQLTKYNITREYFEQCFLYYMSIDLLQGYSHFEYVLMEAIESYLYNSDHEICNLISLAFNYFKSYKTKLVDKKPKLSRTKNNIYMFLVKKGYFEAFLLWYKLTEHNITESQDTFGKTINNYIYDYLINYPSKIDIVNSFINELDLLINEKNKKEQLKFLEQTLEESNRKITFDNSMMIYPQETSFDNKLESIPEELEYEVLELNQSIEDFEVVNYPQLDDWIDILDLIKDISYNDLVNLEMEIKDLI